MIVHTADARGYSRTRWQCNHALLYDRGGSGGEECLPGEAQTARSLESAQLVLDSEAADVLVIKPQLAGGLRVGQQIIQAAAERGVRSVITSTLEAGIGLVAALHLAAASPAITLECGLATLHLLVDDLVMNDLPVRDGVLAVPSGPGLGIALDREALDRYSFNGQERKRFE